MEKATLNMVNDKSKQFSEFLSFLKEDIPVATYLHNTTDEKTAKLILDSGFQFVNYLENSTDEVSTHDEITIKYFFNTRKDYGKYTIILQIPVALIAFCNSFAFEEDLHYYEIISRILEQSEDETYYLLPHKYIKGYYDISKNRLIKNPDFDLSFKPEDFTSGLN